MKLDDRDLELALSPLAGRREDDFQRIMAALPDPAAGRWRRIVPLVTTAAAGIAIGCWIGIRFFPEKQQGQTIAGPRFVAHDPNAPQLLAATGDIALDDETGRALLAPGSTVPFDGFVSTDGAALVGLPGSTEVRIAPGSHVAITSRRSATLMAGLVFVRIHAGQGKFVVETLEGTVESTDGSFQVESGKNVISVVAFEGAARFISNANEGRELQSGEWCTIEDGLVGPSVREVSLYSHAAWQRGLLMRIGREEELVDLLSPLVMLLGQEPFASRAERELRQAGTLGAFALGYGLENLEEGPLRQKCVWLLSRIADRNSYSFLLQLLQDDQADSRVLAAEALERVTGIPSGRDLEFWRSASFAERNGVRKPWRDEILETFR